MIHRPTVLTIGGSDPSGAAGIQADLKTFHQFGCFGTSVLTLVTVQNSEGIRDVSALSPELIAAQLGVVLEDLKPPAVKTGALGTAASVQRVAASLETQAVMLVVDPVLVSTSGTRLLAEDAIDELRDHLIPLATLVTPNLPELEVLTGSSGLDGARRLIDMGAQRVLIKGGHGEDPKEIVDCLVTPQGTTHWRHSRVESSHLRGTGCLLSAAITARMAHGDDPPAAVDSAQRWLQSAIDSAAPRGRGRGSPNHHQPTG